jgi:hypothetical protein
MPTSRQERGRDSNEGLGFGWRGYSERFTRLVFVSTNRFLFVRFPVFLQKCLPTLSSHFVTAAAVAAVAPFAVADDWLSVVVLVYRVFPLLYRAANPET